MKMVVSEIENVHVRVDGLQEYLERIDLRLDSVDRRIAHLTAAVDDMRIELTYVRDTYLSAEKAEQLFFTKDEIKDMFFTKEEIRRTFLTKDEARGIFLTKDEARLLFEEYLGSGTKARVAT